MLHRILLTTAIALVSSTATLAGTQSGSWSGGTWKAQSNIVGQTSTATLAGGGNPLYFASKPKYNGVAALIMDYGGGNRFICSGSLLPDRRSIVTAAHCVSGGAGTANPLTTTAYFYGGPNPDTVVFTSPDSTARTVSQYYVNPGYTGEVIDQNDIAVLRLSEAAPDFAVSYAPYYGDDLTGLRFNVAGYGRRSDTGVSVGANLGVGRLRQGDNRYDFALGDSAFGGFFTDRDPNTGENFFGTADIDFSYLSDVDNGTRANDASCILGGALGVGGSQFCNLGVGALEVSVAGGDSGGPQFYRGKISSVTSYGLSFGRDFGDCTDALDSSCGEFNGFVPLSIHKAFIAGATVPEPATWAMFILGFGLVGNAMRRRRSVAA